MWDEETILKSSKLSIIVHTNWYFNIEMIVILS